MDPRELLRMSFRAHPWHGVSCGKAAPERLTVYIEVVPGDTLKYEIDKVTGILRLDRPQRYSSLCPTLYGFIPQTYCGDQVAARCRERTPYKNVRGDGDPLDVCVLSERSVPKGDFLLEAHPIGGLRMVDGDEADDKIVAVLENDLAYGPIRELADCPGGLIERLRHYFLTYKQLPGESPRKVEIVEVYDRGEALEVVGRSMADYRSRFGAPFDVRWGEITSQL
jgi:inorganic pyrophosphatase